MQAVQRIQREYEKLYAQVLSSKSTLQNLEAWMRLQDSLVSGVEGAETVVLPVMEISWTMWRNSSNNFREYTPNSFP